MKENRFNVEEVMENVYKSHLETCPSCGSRKTKEGNLLRCWTKDYECGCKVFGDIGSSLKDYDFHWEYPCKFEKNFDLSNYSNIESPKSFWEINKNSEGLQFMFFNDEEESKVKINILPEHLDDLIEFCLDLKNNKKYRK